MARLIFLVLALSCAGQSAWVPMVPRPDTRGIGAIQLDSSVVRRTLEILQAALPAEAALCYAGAVRDTTLHGHATTYVKITRVTQALADSTTEFYVFFPAYPRTGCTDPIATGHSHPYAGTGPCTHSDLDVNVLFTDPRLLASLVWCGDGRLEILYQDGRRSPGRWRP